MSLSYKVCNTVWTGIYNPKLVSTVNTNPSQLLVVISTWLCNMHACFAEERRWSVYLFMSPVKSSLKRALSFKSFYLLKIREKRKTVEWHLLFIGEKNGKMNKAFCHLWNFYYRTLMRKKHFEENKEAESLIELHDLIRQGVILSHGIYI